MTISNEIRARIREQAKNRCGYCQISGEYVYAPMEIDHLLPQALDGSDDENNLWLACPRCNSFKGIQTHAIDPDTRELLRLFNPREQEWQEHFEWGEDRALIRGITPCGRATVESLRLNYTESLMLRRLLVQVGWYPPE